MNNTVPRSRTCAPGCACGSTRTTTRLFCAPSPRPNATPPDAGRPGRVCRQGAPVAVWRAVRAQPAGRPARPRHRRPARVWPRAQRPAPLRRPHAGASRRRAPFWPTGWKDIGYEQHLHDSADSPAQAAARWANVLDFCDWMAGAAAARSRTRRASACAPSPRTPLEVAQTISLISTLNEREQDPQRAHPVHPARRQGKKHKVN